MLRSLVRRDLGVGHGEDAILQTRLDVLSLWSRLSAYAVTGGTRMKLAHRELVMTFPISVAYCQSSARGSPVWDHTIVEFLDRVLSGRTRVQSIVRMQLSR